MPKSNRLVRNVSLGLALLLCVQSTSALAFAAPEPGVEKLATQLTQAEDSVVKDVFWTAIGSRLGKLALRYGPRILTLSAAATVSLDAAVAPVAPLWGQLAENNRNVIKYYGILWKKFLNDPVYMSPVASGSNTIYIREVFNQAARKVTDALKQKYTSDICDPAQNGERPKCRGINPNRVFLSETYFSDHALYQEGQEKKAIFYIPATDFFSGSFEDKVNKVAIDLAGEVSWLLFRKQVYALGNTLNPNGQPKGWNVFQDSLPFHKAAKVWAAQLLDLPAPNVRLSEFDGFIKECKKYVEDCNIEKVPAPRTQDLKEFEDKITTFRIQPIATMEGQVPGVPNKGMPVISNCVMRGQEAVIAHPIPECVTIHIREIVPENLDATNTIEKARARELRKVTPVVGQKGTQWITDTATFLVTNLVLRKLALATKLAKFANTRKGMVLSALISGIPLVFTHDLISEDKIEPTDFNTALADLNYLHEVTDSTGHIERGAALETSKRLKLVTDKYDPGVLALLGFKSATDKDDPGAIEVLRLLAQQTSAKH